MSIDNIEKRIYDFEIRRSDPESRTLEGYAALYDSLSVDLGGYREIIQRGAFDHGLLSASDVRAFFDHKGVPLARSTSHSGKTPTLSLSADDKGLKFTFEVPQSRQDILEAVDRGDIRENSFAFIAQDWAWEKRNGENVRIIKRFKQIFDISVVAFAAYPDTTVAKRSFDLWEKENTNPVNDSLDQDTCDAILALQSITLNQPF